MVASLFGLRFGWPFASRPGRPVVDEAELAGHEMLAGRAVEHEEVAVARRRHHQLAHPAVERHVDENRRLRRIPVVRVVRRGLVVPRHLAGIDVHREQRRREQVVAFAAALRVCRRRVAGAVDVEIASPDRRRRESTWRRCRGAPRRGWPRSRARDRLDSAASNTGSTAPRRCADRATSGTPARRGRCRCRRARGPDRPSARSTRSTAGRTARSRGFQTSLPVFASRHTTQSSCSSK